MTLLHHPSPDPKLVSPTPTASAPANVRISHVQLRDLIVCPAERGVLWYVSDNSIIEQDILSSTPERQRTLAALKFTPVTLSTLRLASSHPSGKDLILLAAGGQDAELYLALYVYTPRRTPKQRESANSLRPELNDLSSTPDISIDLDEDTDIDVKDEEQAEAAGYSTPVWQHTSSLVGSINNNVLLYMPPHPSESRAISPRLVVSNNDCTVKFFDVCLARKGLRCSASLRPQDRMVDPRYWRQDPTFRVTCEGEGWGEKGIERIVRYERVGCLRLPVPVNHTSISPDGSTVLSCGDTSTIYLHRILPIRDGSSLLFEKLATYTIPPPTPHPPLPLPTTSSSNPQRRSVGSRHSSYQDPGGAYLPFAFVNGSWVLAGPHAYLNDVSGVEIPPACFTTAWSADGMRFAVASQEGMVRIWDVRSKEPLACASWETGPGGTLAEAQNEGMTDAGSSSMTVDAQHALYGFTGGAPPWGVRSLKFARNVSGRELLVFTEHVSRVHIIDADTFSRHDLLRIPHVPSSTSGPSNRDDIRLPPFRHAPTATQLYTIAPSSLPRWMDNGSADAPIQGYIPRFLIDTSAVWRGSGDDAPSGTEGGSASPRLASRLESRARARRLGLVPPRMSVPDSREGRVLSPSIPLTRSPEPTASLVSAEYAVSEEALNESNSYQPNRTRSGLGDLSVVQRTSEHVRLRARERERREVDQEQNELRRRSPASRLRDDAQMEEDIAYHTALERVRSEREQERDRMRSARASLLARMELRRAQAEQMREDERERDDMDTGREEADGDDERGPVVIPPLSSARSEEDVRSVLAMHGIQSVRSTAVSETEAQDSRSEQSSSVQDPDDRRPGSSSASTSSTSLSEVTGVSTRAQAGSLVGERQSRSARARANSLLTPSIRNMRATQAALRAIDEYRMEVDEEEGNTNDGDDSDSTELDCAEPGVVTDGNIQASTVFSPRPTEPFSSPEVTVSSSTSVSSSSAPVVSTSPLPSSSTFSSDSNTSPTIASDESSTRSSSQASATQSQTLPQTHSLPPCRELIESTDRLDIAGITFDPSGAYIYVVTVDGITEWAVQGVDQRWWHAGGYI